METTRIDLRVVELPNPRSQEQIPTGEASVLIQRLRGVIWAYNLGYTPDPGFAARHNPWLTTGSTLGINLIFLKPCATAALEHSLGG